MVTNVPSKCAPFWEKYEEASTPKEKIQALEELIACIPKHKGTEKLLKDLKMKLAKLRAELARAKEAGKSRASSIFSVPKKGDAQIVILGTSYAGKTTLVNMLTGSKYEVGRPTLRPQEGIFKWEGIEFQLVDTPPIMSADLDKTPNGRAIMGIVYNADMVLLVIDATQDLYWQIDALLGSLAEAGIYIRARPPIRLKRLPRGGITILGVDYAPFELNEIKELLQMYRITNCIVEFLGPVDEEELSLALNPKVIFKKSVVTVTKLDLINDPKRIIQSLKEYLTEKKIYAPIVPMAPTCDKCKWILGETLFRELNMLRVWTKKDGKVNWKRALVLRAPATVRDACEKIHSSFVRRFRYAIVERESDKIKRKIVGLDFELKDGDIITIYVRD